MQQRRRCFLEIVTATCISYSSRGKLASDGPSLWPSLLFDASLPISSCSLSSVVFARGIEKLRAESFGYFAHVARREKKDRSCRKRRKHPLGIRHSTLYSRSNDLAPRKGIFFDLKATLCSLVADTYDSHSRSRSKTISNASKLVDLEFFTWVPRVCPKKWAKGDSYACVCRVVEEGDATRSRPMRNEYFRSCFANKHESTTITDFLFAADSSTSRLWTFEKKKRTGRTTEEESPTCLKLTLTRVRPRRVRIREITETFREFKRHPRAARSSSPFVLSPSPPFPSFYHRITKILR